MTKLLAVVSLALLLLPAVALAAGPHDGAYVVTETNVGLHHVETYHIVVVERGQDFGFAALFASGSWGYGIGTFTSPTTAEGTLYLVNGTPYGTFSVTVSRDTIAGQVVYLGTPYAISGVRFF
jgi:hypothetical protein